ncbi:motility associated factor glycosyltransferase family protein [Paraclostridium bifermentans]|uniref:motility associated factor glycosyltransferase family protein n=1 Tax=Paraclostridium bifermentans TaxID=1490 RepID=UPI00374FA195
MKSEQLDLKENLKDIRFDEIIIMFGFNKGEYLECLKESICEKNKVYIIEPNDNEYEQYKGKINDKNISLISINDENLDFILGEIINGKNFFNFNVQICENYDVLYKEEWTKLKTWIDSLYDKCSVYLSTMETFKKITLENILSNLNEINNSYKFDSYINVNKNVPCIVVSAGPSLDKNLEVMVENKDKLDKFFIIAGNRTLKPLLENGIQPDAVISVDPQDITYDMVKDGFYAKVPLIYCEKSNSKLVREYEGKKVVVSQGALNIIENLKDMIVCMSGGSVAHTCTDIAFLLGCNPIVFVGQDFAYTNEKNHALVAKNKIDSEFNKEECIVIKDINGEDIYSCDILNLYKENLENMLKLYIKLNKDIEFKNASYGANIDYAKHEELSNILNYNYKEKKVNIDDIGENININTEEIVFSMKNYLNKTKNNIKKSKEICENILRQPNQDNIMQFGLVLSCIDDFIKNENSIYIENYISSFLVYIKEKLFNMKSSEYDKLSKDIMYQCKVFREYMNDLDELLSEISEVVEQF